MKVLYTTLLVLFLSLSANAHAITITLQPDSPQVGNCFPFGGDGDPDDNMSPYMGFIYQNVPAFSMAAGDIIAFDTANTENNVAIELDIELAPTTVNGGNIASDGFTKIVSNTQQAADPNGNTVMGDYELAFTAEAAFSFPGGGLIVRFSNESAAYAADNDCTQNLVNANGQDSSGFFVERFYADADGLAPYDRGETGTIGALQLIVGEGPGVTAINTTPVPSNSFWSLLLMALLLAGIAARVIRQRV